MLGLTYRLGVEPSDEELERIIVFVWQSVGLVATRILLLVVFVEDGREEFRVIAEQTFVKRPMGRLGAYIYVGDPGCKKPGSESADILGRSGAGRRQIERTHSFSDFSFFCSFFCSLSLSMVLIDRSNGCNVLELWNVLYSSFKID